MRESRGWTLEKIADQSGLSKAYLSRVEGGERQPSIAALLSIAKVFGVSIAALFEQPDESIDCVIVRGGSTPAQNANGLAFVPLSSSTKPFNLHPISVTIPAHRAGNETYQHDGEEWLYVISGRVGLSINGKTQILEVGDGAHFDSRLAHRLDALDDAEARVLLVACPIPITLNGHPRQRSESLAGLFAG